MTQASAVRRQSIRVALGATLVVGIVYAFVSVAVISFATIALTGQVDAQLSNSFGRLPPSVDSRPPGNGFDPGNDPGRPFGPRTLVWIISSDGTVMKLSTTPDLPAELVDVTAPVTATIDGQDVRAAGTQVGSNRVIVAQSLAPVQDAQRTILLGTLLIAPLLVIAVFLGAVVVGRRVAAPVEEARRRQLEFTADASHELRTPLAVIEANTSLALTQDRDVTWYRTAFTRVDKESKRMHGLLEDLLWLARFDAGRSSAASEPVDLATVARQSADRFGAIAETRRLQLTVDMPTDPVNVAASVDLLDRLVGVLLDNACKYAPEGGQVAIRVARDAGRPTLTVEDSGPGIADEDRARVFDRFHRSVGTAGQADGAGLGLAIADAVVRATRGRWLVSRSPLGGARFSVKWPAST